MCLGHRNAKFLCKQKKLKKRQTALVRKAVELRKEKEREEMKLKKAKKEEERQMKKEEAEIKNNAKSSIRRSRKPRFRFSASFWQG